MVLPKATREKGWPFLRGVREHTTNEGPLQQETSVGDRIQSWLNTYPIIVPIG